VLTLFRLRPGTFRPARYGLLALRGLVGGTSALLYYLAIARIPAGTATFLNNLSPVFAIAGSVLFLHERPTLHLSLALLLAGAGVFLVLGHGFTFAFGWGEVLALLSAIAGGIAVTTVRVLRASVNAPTVFLSFSLGGLLVSVTACTGGWPSAPLAWLFASVAGMVAFFAQIAMTEAYGALSIPEAALWQMLTPVSAYLFATAIGEPIRWTTALGLVLGAVGIVYGSVLGHHPTRGGFDAAEVRRARDIDG
jgi:drug/metabolite transporter (DMT)-like permease